MLTSGTMVEVFEDPLTMQVKEGNATVVAFVQELDHGLNQYIVHFMGDGRGFHVVRAIYEGEPLMCCCLEFEGDNAGCKVHGVQVPAHWVGGER